VSGDQIVPSAGPAKREIEVIASPLPERPGRFEVRGANGVLLTASSRSPFCDAAISLLSQNYNADMPLIIRFDAGVRRATIGEAAGLANRLTAAAAQCGIPADAIPTEQNEAALVRFRKRISRFKLDPETENEIAAAAFPDMDSTVTPPSTPPPPITTDTGAPKVQRETPSEDVGDDATDTPVDEHRVGAGTTEPKTIDDAEVNAAEPELERAPEPTPTPRFDRTAYKPPATPEPKKQAGKVINFTRAKPAKAPLPPDENAIEATLDGLADLNDLDYQMRRKDAAKELRIQVKVLDKQVADRRKRLEKDGTALPHWQVDPWPDAVGTDVLLESIIKVFNRYIVLPKHASEALALWILHDWTFDAVDISPFVVVMSPTKRCGKTSVLILLYWLTRRSELAGNISAAAIFRYIEDQQPTLIIDEADSFLAANDEMRGILNSGHTRAAAHVIRTVEIGGQHKAQRFSTWAPKVIASIGALAGTLEDRAIVVRMQRKPKGAKVQRLQRRDCAEFEKLRQQALRWATDNLEGLRSAAPALPDALNDRAADNWEPLLAIAELGGKAWTQRARTAALALSGDEATADDEHGVELLRDIRTAFDANNPDAIFTKTLIDKLTADEERPWASYSRTGKSISGRQIAKLLVPFGIISGTVRIGEWTAKGYKRADFEAIWGVYFPSPSQEPAFYPSQRHNADEMGTSGAFSSVTKPGCDGCENGNLSNNDGHCDVVTDKSQDSGRDGHLDREEDDQPAISAGPHDRLGDLDPRWRR
jgi:hypothetical protein